MLLFSLIVPTLNRDEELRALFLSLEKQSCKDFEVIVVDQNSDNRVATIVHEFSKRISVVRLVQKTRGASIARNTGIDIAKGKILTFPDDDCEYPPDLLQTVKSLFEMNRHLDGLTCSSISVNGTGSVARLSKTSGPISKLNILSKMVEFTIFVKASALKEDRFDENFGPGAKSNLWCDEGPDLLLRLMARGERFEYFHDQVIYHPNPTVVFDEKAFTRSFRYGMARGKYLAKHRYPFWFVCYVWALYVAGIGIGIIQLKPGKIKYYFVGLKGRIKGYFI